MTVQDMSSMRRDFIAAHLRLVLCRLRIVLDNIEEECAAGRNHAHESLKQIEDNLRRIRKLCAHN